MYPRVSHGIQYPFLTPDQSATSFSFHISLYLWVVILFPPHIPFRSRPYCQSNAPFI